MNSCFILIPDLPFDGNKLDAAEIKTENLNYWIVIFHFHTKNTASLPHIISLVESQICFTCALNNIITKTSYIKLLHNKNQ